MREKREAESTHEVMTTVWKQRKFTDAEVVCNGVRIPVHRSTMAAVSPVFEAAFSSAMREGETAAYVINNSIPEAVEAMACFVYTGEMPAVELLAPVFELAVQYELEGLANGVAAKMLDEVSVSNVKAFMNVLNLHSSTNASAETAREGLLCKIKEAPTYDLLRAFCVPGL